MMLVCRTWVAIVALVAAGACSKKEDAGAAKPAGDPKATAGEPAAKAPGTAAATAATPPPADPVAKEPPPVAPASAIKVDDEVMAAIKAVVASCEIDPKAMSIKCAGDEDKKINDGFLGYGEGARTPVALIPTVAVALADPDPKMQTVAASMLGSSRFSGAWGEGVKVGDVSKEVATTLLKAIGGLGEYQARRSMPAVMLAASLADADAEAYALLEGHADKYVVSSGWKASTLYGRLKPFAKLEAMAAAGDPAQTLLAATALNSFYQITDEERATLCPWAFGKIDADAPEVEEAEIFGQVGAILTKCRGEWVDKLLAFGEAQRAKKKFDRQYYFVFREMCHDFIKGESNANVTEAQCNANYKFLEAVANTDGVPPTFRGYALDSISYQRRDATSLKLMKKYAKHKVPEIKTTALEAIKMLEGYVK